ncbi:MAG: hypothetical protein C4326_07800 [Ignavibacteria bacterium]
MRPEDHYRLLLYFEAEDTGGVSNTIETLVRSIPPTSLTLLYRDSTPVTEWAKRLSADGTQVYPYALHNKFDIYGWFDFPRMARLIIPFRSADIIHFHLHTPFACLPAIFLARMIGRKQLVTTEQYVTQVKYLRRRKLPFPLRLVRELRIRLLISLKRLSLRYLDSIVLVSEANRDFFLSMFGQRFSDKTRTISNGIDLDRYSPEFFKDVSLQEFGIDRKPSHIITVVAGLNNQKGHAYLLQAIPSILVRFPFALFLFVGDGHLREQLERIACDLKVDHSVVFMGKREDVRQILAITDVFVLPSLFEGMPLSVLEAMAMGKPVVATKVDGTAEAVTDGISGYLVPPRDSTALASRIIELLADPLLRAEFGQHARERVRSLFSADLMSNKYLSLYISLLQR